MKHGIKKILILSIWEDIWSLGEGGGVADELQFIRCLTKQGIELHFLIPKPKEKKEMLQDALLVYHTYPNVFGAFRFLPGIAQRCIWAAAFPLAVMGRLRKLADELKPDVVMGFTHHSLLPLNRIGKETLIPTVVKLFGVMYLDRFDFPRIKYLWKSFEQIVALRSPVDHYIILNDGTRGEMALARLGIPPEKMSFFPNGMDTEWADMPVNRAEARRIMGLPSDDILVVTLSRLIQSKRIELFLRAAAMMDESLREHVTVVIGGDGPERRRLENEVRSLGLGGKVIFTGVIPHRDVVHFLKASDIFGATNELTNMSLPPCEALLCGVPVVAFDVSGTSEVVRDGETGLLARNGDVASFSKKLEALVRDHDLRNRLGRQAAQFARAHFVSWDDRIEMELEVLDRIASQKKRRRGFS